jgi:glyoxylase-like metal-dependent hydrolase (beta-lactamase superfamily II)
MRLDVELPPGIHVLVRGWLNCNQIVLLGKDSNILIDSGYGRDASKTLALLKQPAFLGNRPLHRLINTHCHSDHMGGNALLQATYRCQISIPEGEVKHVDPWTEQSCWAEMTGQYAQQFTYDDTLAAGEIFYGGGYKWDAIAAPGHDMNALMFFCEEEQVLVTGDALWENGLGFIWPASISPEGNAPISPYVAAALDTLDRIELLHPRLVIPGHGAPFGDVSFALDRARGRLRAFADDPHKNARHVVKVMFVFALLERGRMAVHEIPRYLASVPIFREMTGLSAAEDFKALAEQLVTELVAQKAIRLESSWAIPCMPA